MLNNILDKYPISDPENPSRKQRKADYDAAMKLIERDKPIKFYGRSRARKRLAALAAAAIAFSVGTVSVGAYTNWDFSKLLSGIFTSVKGKSPETINLEALELNKYGREINEHYDFEGFSLDILGAVSDGKVSNVLFGINYEDSVLIPCFNENGSPESGLIPRSCVVEEKSSAIKGTWSEAHLNFDGTYGTFGISAFDDTLTGKEVTFKLMFLNSHDDILPMIAEQEITIDFDFIENEKYIEWNSESGGEYIVYEDSVNYLDTLPDITEEDCAFILDRFCISPFGISLKIKESDSPLYDSLTTVNIAWNGLGCTMADGAYIDLFADTRVSNDLGNVLMTSFLYPIETDNIVSFTYGGTVIPIK